MENVRMKTVDTQFLKVPEYKRDNATSTSKADVREHAVAYPIFDLVTPKDEEWEPG